MQESKVQAFRELRPEEILVVAGGQTAGEMEIQGIYNGSVITDQGDGYAMSNDGVMFVDNDGNGWYDYAEFSAGGTVYIYDCDSDSWVDRDQWEDHDKEGTVEG